MRRPLNADPSRTLTIRKQFVSEMNKRFRSLAKEVTEAVYKQDVFGLSKQEPFKIFNSNIKPVVLAKNVQWQEFRFSTDAQKTKQFRQWLQSQIDAKILSVDVNGAPWTGKYVESAYKKGIVRAYVDSTKRRKGLKSPDFYEGSKRQFLESAFAAPETLNKIELVSTRAFEQLRGITPVMSSRINTILANGLANGIAPDVLARQMVKSVDGITKTRARMIARTEVIYAHAEGQLDSFELMGVEELGVQAEWSTAGDDEVCPLCADLSGVVLSVKEARGLLPRHPNCRCAFIPAFTDMKEKGQKRGARAKAALERSRVAGLPKDRREREEAA